MILYEMFLISLRNWWPFVNTAARDAVGNRGHLANVVGADILVTILRQFSAISSASRHYSAETFACYFSCIFLFILPVNQHYIEPAFKCLYLHPRVSYSLHLEGYQDG